MRPHVDSCPTCRCIPTQTSLQRWSDQHLIHTGNPADRVTSGELFSSYLTWFSQQATTEFFYTQNKLTRGLRAQGHHFHTLSGGNHLIGYRLAT